MKVTNVVMMYNDYNELISFIARFEADYATGNFDGQITIPASDTSLETIEADVKAKLLEIIGK